MVEHPGVTPACATSGSLAGRFPRQPDTPPSGDAESSQAAGRHRNRGWWHEVRNFEADTCFVTGSTPPSIRRTPCRHVHAPAIVNVVAWTTKCTPNKAVRAPHATEPDPNDLPDDSTRSRRHEQDDPPRRPELEDQPVDTDRMPVLHDQEGYRNCNKRAGEKAGVKWPPCGGPRRLRPGFGGTAYTPGAGATVMSLAIAWGLFAHGAFSLSIQSHGRCPGGVSSWTCPPDPPCTGGTPERTGEGRDAGVRGDRHASCCGTTVPR